MHCKSCRFGRYHAADQTFMSQYGDQLIVINNVPAHRCDMCGHTCFDEAFTNRLQLLLDQLTNNSPIVNEQVVQETKPDSQSWHPARRSN